MSLVSSTQLSSFKEPLKLASVTTPGTPFSTVLGQATESGSEGPSLDSTSGALPELAPTSSTTLSAQISSLTLSQNNEVSGHHHHFSHHIFASAVKIVSELKTVTDPAQKTKLEDRLDKIINHMMNHAVETGSSDTLDKLTALMNGLDPSSSPFKTIQKGFSEIKSFKAVVVSSTDDSGFSPQAAINKMMEKLQCHLSELSGDDDGDEDDDNSTQNTSTTDSTTTSTETTDTTPTPEPTPTPTLAPQS